MKADLKDATVDIRMSDAKGDEIFHVQRALKDWTWTSSDRGTGTFPGYFLYIRSDDGTDIWKLQSGEASGTYFLPKRWESYRLRIEVVHSSENVYQANVMGLGGGWK